MFKLNLILYVFLYFMIFHLFINDRLVFFVYNSGTNGHRQELSLNLPTGPIQFISRYVRDMCVCNQSTPHNSLSERDGDF